MRDLPKGVPLLFVNTLFYNVGFFAFIPFLSVYLIDQLHWTPALTGLLLMVRQVSQQGPTFFTGMLADKVGLKRIVCFGQVVRGLGFMAFAFISSPSAIFAAAMVAGLGGAFFGPAGSGILAHLTPEEDRSRIYALQKTIANVGVVLSTALGAILIHLDFALLSLICGGIYLVLAIVSFWKLPDVKSKLKKLSFKAMGQIILHDKLFLGFVAAMCGVWFLYMQLYLTLPLQIFAMTGSKAAISTLNLMVAAVVITLQYPLLTWVNKEFSLIAGMRIGVLLLGTGIAIMGYSEDMTVFYSGLFLYACGVIIVDPLFSDITARMASPELMATYFGVASIAIAVGGGISQGLGGWLFQQGPGLVWGSCIVVTLVVVTGLRQLARQEEREHALTEQEKTA